MAQKGERPRCISPGRREEMRGSFCRGLRSGGEKVNAKSRMKESELRVPPRAGTERMWQVTGEGRTLAPKSQLAGSGPRSRDGSRRWQSHRNDQKRAPFAMTFHLMGTTGKTWREEENEEGKWSFLRCFHFYFLSLRRCRGEEGGRRLPLISSCPSVMSGLNSALSQKDGK